MKKFLTHPTWEKDVAEKFVELMITLNSKEFLTIINSKEFINGKSGLPLLQQVQERLDANLTKNGIGASYYTIEGDGLYVHFDDTFLKMKVFEVNSLVPDSETLAVKFWGQNINDPFESDMPLNSYLKQNFIPILIEWNESEDHPLVGIVEEVQNFDIQKALDEHQTPFGDEVQLISMLEGGLQTFKSNDWEITTSTVPNGEMWCWLKLRPNVLRQFDEKIDFNTKMDFSVLTVNLIFEKNPDSTMKMTYQHVGTIESPLVQGILTEKEG